MTGTAGSESSPLAPLRPTDTFFFPADKTPKDFSDSAPGGMSTSNNPDEIPADAKALEPDAGEEAKKVSSERNA
jgi:hypothetical protein